MAKTRGLTLLVVLALTGCGDDPPAATTCSGEVLFGRPSAATGLTAAQCQPSCSCGGATWEAPAYTAADADELRGWQLLEPPAELASDPYAIAAPAPPGPDVVCAVERDAAAARTYRLRTFASAADAEAAGAVPSHHGACGVCSPLADLAVYMAHPDLTEPVRACGLEHAGDTAAEHIECLQALGFTYPCAQIWYFNTLHTRDRCAAPCFLALGKPYHLADGTLNDCLQCDEVESGAVFKAIAGRTRRNTGLASTMCRPCSEVRPLAHDY